MTPSDVEADRKPLCIYTVAINETGGHFAFKPFAMRHVVFVEESDYLAATARIAEMEAQWAAQDDAWCDRVEVLSSGIAALEARVKELEAALTAFKAFYPMGINPYLDDAYRQALRLLGDKP